MFRYVAQKVSGQYPQRPTVSYEGSEEIVLWPVIDSFTQAEENLLSRPRRLDAHANVSGRLAKAVTG